MAGKNSWSYDATTFTLVIHLRVAVSTTPGSKIALTVQLVDPPNCEYLSKSVGFPARLASRILSRAARFPLVHCQEAWCIRICIRNFPAGGGGGGVEDCE